MPFTPEDSRRPEEDRFKEMLIKAHARVFELAHECCHEVRELMMQCDATYPTTEEELAECTQLTATQISETGEMTVCVRLGIHGQYQVEGLKEIQRIDRTSVEAELKHRTVRKIFKDLESEHREVIAEFLSQGGYAEVAEQHHTDYERLIEMHTIIDQLKVRIMNGDLPVPPPKIWFQSEGTM